VQPVIGWIYCVGLLAIGGALWVALTVTPPWMSADDVHAELVKVALQVVVFGLAGGGVKLLLDRQTEYRKFRADLLDRLGRAHKEVYRVRRLLPTGNPEEDRRLLGELMDARQDLGAAYHAARIWGLGSKVKDIQRETEAMREYLESVISGALAAEDAPSRGAYVAFLGWRTPGEYESRFKASYTKAKKLVDPRFRPSNER
jgi:hypothetical protein